MKLTRFVLPRGIAIDSNAQFSIKMPVAMEKSVGMHETLNIFQYA